MDEMKRLIFLDKKLNPCDVSHPTQPYLVLSDAEIHDLVSNAEKNLESKMKLQTLLNVVLVYSVIGLAAPFLYFLFCKDI